MMPVAGSMPRRGRQLIPAGLPYGREAVAACAVLVLLAHLLLAQLTLVLVLAFAAITRLSRWRRWWLLVPAAAGLLLTLAVGPAHAAAGFAAGAAHVLGYLGQGQLAVRVAHPLGAFSQAGSWLPGQLPIALMAAAAEAAVLGWLDWLRTDEWAVAPPRPGLVAVTRGALAARLIGTGSVVTRAGCALGMVAATGAIAELRWSEVASGALVAGASTHETTLTSLQVVHAALRRRKPLVVIDTVPDTDAGASVARAIQAACRATGTPLRTGDTDLGLVIAQRAAVLVAARSPDEADRACRDLTALAANLRRIGVDGDALIWVPRGEQLPAGTLTALIHAGGAAGLAVLITTASPAAAAELAGAVGALLIHRIADPELAVSLAGRTGTRLRSATASASASGAGAGAAGFLPGSPDSSVPGWATPPMQSLRNPVMGTWDAPALGLLNVPVTGRPNVPVTGRPNVPGAAALDAPAWEPLDAPAWQSRGVPAAGAVSASAMRASAGPGGPWPGAGAVASGANDFMAAAGLVPYPVVPARTLLSLAPAQFVLAVSASGRRRAEIARLVPARLPRGDAALGPGRRW